MMPKANIRVVLIAASMIGTAAQAYQFENYRVVSAWSSKNPGSGYSHFVLIADGVKNRFVQCNVFIHETNNRQFDKAQCFSNNYNHKSTLVKYSVTAVPIDENSEVKYRSYRRGVWLVDPDTGKGEFCTWIDNTGYKCFDLPSVP